MSAPARVSVAVSQTLALAERSVKNSSRELGTWLPSVVFSLLMAAIYSAQFGRATELAAFPPVDSFFQFILPASVLQAIAFNSGEMGAALARDIETGFFDRLITSPAPRQSILVGRMAGGMVASSLVAMIIMGVFSVFGAAPAGGLGAAAGIMVVAAVLSVAVGGVSVAVALRTGSVEVTQSIFPLTFMVIFVSSAFFPTELMSGWYAEVAQRNPFTLIVDPTRRLAVEGFSFAALGQAMAWTVAVAVVTLSMAYRAYLSRLRAS